MEGGVLSWCGHLLAVDVRALSCTISQHCWPSIGPGNDAQHPNPSRLPAPLLQTVPPSESPMPAFARWVAAQQVAGTLEVEVKGEEGAALWTAEAARAAKEGGLEAPPALPTAAEEEAACAVAGGR